MDYSCCNLPSGITILELGKPCDSLREILTGSPSGKLLLLNQDVPVTRLIGNLVTVDPLTGDEILTPTVVGAAELHVRFAGDLDIATTEYDDIIIPQFFPGVYDPANTDYQNEHWTGFIPLASLNLIPKESVVYFTMGLKIGTEIIIDEACGFYVPGGI